MSKVTFKVISMQNEADARRVSDFFLSEHSFDDQRHTPGELVHFSQWPLESLNIPNHRHWYVENEAGAIIGVISVRENEHQTGGYLWDYMVVHSNYRRMGIASRLFETMLEFVKAQGGRFVLTYTCDLPQYGSVQRMFRQLGFDQIGSYPDYYYEGEARLAFWKKM
jgi:ribosomal protein S18 acetylase RimI-like enzyme